MSKKILALCVSVLLIACQTTGSTGVTYSVFFTPEDHMASLIEEGDYEGADQVLAKQREFFSNDNGVLGDDFKPLVVKLTTSIYGPKEAEVKSSLETMESWISQNLTREGWSSLDQDIKEAGSILTHFDRFSVFNEKAFLPETVSKLRTLRGEVQARITENAAAAFADYDLLSEPSFFDVYPMGNTFSE